MSSSDYPESWRGGPAESERGVLSEKQSARLVCDSVTRRGIRLIKVSHNPPLHDQFPVDLCTTRIRTLLIGTHVLGGKTVVFYIPTH